MLRDGTVFATYFTWKVYEKGDAPAALRPGTYHHMMDKWIGVMAGTYTIRSSDGGKTWDHPVRVELGDVVIRGNCVEMEDGSIIAPLYGQHDGSGGASDVIVGRTSDRGQKWERLAIVSSDGGQYHFHEPNLYQTPSGKLILFIRSVRREVDPGERHLASPLFIAESTDGGRTWTEPKMWPIYSPSPFHLLRLQDGRIVLNYGYRLVPYGIRAFVLDPECSNLATVEETVLRDDGHGTDIGYTSAVQLADGRILIVYYYYDGEEDYSRYIAGTLCQAD
ncbi:exo-alpha-sialidase [Paenibacillus sp. GCM10027626]|uniref:exo-alpha-sialidase n=1 Tax=Paenibacillus sp. GCM10027626 TaxID=3273411 RepID=UPI00363D034A